MFGELPKLFDRDFALGYFLPVTLLLTASLALFAQFGLLPDPLALSQSALIFDSTVFSIATWLGGVLLLVINRDLFRLLEGYGRSNPARLLAGRERQRYTTLRQAIDDLNAEYKASRAAGTEFLPAQQARRNRFLREMAEQFPDQERWLQPTGFGNILRAFETYPRVVYGVEAVEGWNRLLAVLPRYYRELVDGAKAQVDFWVNLWLVSLLFAGEYLGLALATGHLPVVWVHLLALALGWLAYGRAKSAALEWGDMVKAAFDVFLPLLGQRLGFALPADRAAERQLWTSFSQALIYRQPSTLPPRHVPPHPSVEEDD